jgi:hypothetical protein
MMGGKYLDLGGRRRRRRKILGYENYSTHEL